MSLATQIKDDGAYFTSMTDELAVEATYTLYSSGVEHEVTVILDQIKNFNQVSEGRTILDSAIAHVALAFVPTIYDTLTIDGVEYKVNDYGVSHGLYILDISKDSRPTHHHTKGRFR